MHQETHLKSRGIVRKTAARPDFTTLIAIALALPLVLSSAAILLFALTSPNQQRLAIASPSVIESHTQLRPKTVAPLPDDPALRLPSPTEVTSAPVAPPTSVESVPVPPVNEPASNRATPAQVAAPRQLIDGYNPDTYSLLSDLHAAIVSGAWQDAAQIITSSRAVLATGVAPDAIDKSLLTTLPIAFQRAHQTHPQIRAARGDAYAALARLRVAEAMELSDGARLSLATAQFPDTPAAADAHEWLADHALAKGMFTTAIEHYEQSANADKSQASKLAPRLHLARALLGHGSFPALTQDVMLGKTTVPAAEFDAILAELKSNIVATSESSSSIDIPPANLAVISPRLIKLNNPGDAEAHRRSPHHSSTNSALTLDVEALYVSTPFGLLAHDLADGHLLWQFMTEVPRDSIQPSAPSPRVLVEADRIYLRLSGASGQRLVCLDKATGKLLWTTESRDREWIATEALVADNQLVALGVRKDGNQQCTVRLYIVDRRSGRFLAEHDVIQLRSDWHEQSNAEWIRSGPHFFVAFSGATISLDVQGNLRWVRLSPQTIATNNDTQRPSQRLLVQGSQAFLQELESNSVLALEVETGRLLWRSPMPSGSNLAGVVNDRLIVSAGDEVRGLATEDGSETWKLAAAHALRQPLLVANGVLLGQHSQAGSNTSRLALRLTWIDATSGRVHASADVPGIETPGAIPEQLVARNGRLWCSLSTEGGDHALLELINAKQAARLHAPTHQLSSSSLGR